MSDPLFAVEGLRVRFPGDPLRGTCDHVAVVDVSLALRPGRILCLVGESGAGKSTVAAAVLGLVDPPGRIEAGRILLGGVDLAALDERAMRAGRGRRVGAIFQDPLSALNPVLTIGRQMILAIRHATGLSPHAARERAAELLDQVAIPDPELRLRQYPHQLSGGMRQRVVIATAIAGAPELLVADEPTTALDVSIQAEVLDVIRDLARTRRIGVLLITHDMAVVAEIADEVAVMRHGRLVEAGPAAQVLFAPREAYTRALIDAVPRPDAAPPAPHGSDAPILELSDVSVTFPGPRTLRATRSARSTPCRYALRAARRWGWWASRDRASPRWPASPAGCRRPMRALCATATATSPRSPRIAACAAMRSRCRRCSRTSSPRSIHARPCWLH